MALLFLIDLSVGLLGRLNAQLQLTALAFPAKMLAAIAALSALPIQVGTQAAFHSRHQLAGGHQYQNLYGRNFGIQ